MRLGLRLPVAICAAAIGCGGDGVTAPTDTDRAAAELERAAADMGFAAGPAGALTFHSAAAALRGGARVSMVDITVDGVTEKWNAFAHEMQIHFPPGFAAPTVEPPPPMRALLAWKATGSSIRFMHLMADADRGEVGDPLDGISDDAETFVFPAILLYSEGRTLLWQAVSGEHSSSVSRSATPCPAPRRPAGAPPAPECVEATFTFSLSGVSAQPFTRPPFLVGQSPSNLASGTRSLSMTPQTVAGVSMKLSLPIVGLVPLSSRAPR